MSTTPPPAPNDSAVSAEDDAPLAFSGIGMLGGIFVAPVMLLLRFPRMFRLYSMAPIVRIAIIIVLLGMVLLLGNEVYSARKIGRLGDLHKSIVSIPADAVNAAHDGEVVHLSGAAKGAGLLVDPDTKISADALRLVRKVEMMQWKETKSKKAGDPASYDKVWSEKPISSIAFQERGKSNPSSMPYRSASWSADPLTVGAFTLSKDLASQIDADRPLEVTSEMLAQMPNKADAQLDAPYVYLGADPRNPHVGDVRISYQTAPAGQPVSIAAVQHGNRLGGEGEMEVLKLGNLTSGQLVAHAQGNAAAIAWALRVVGALVIYFGLVVLFSVTALFGELIIMSGNLITLGFQALKVIITAVLSALCIGLGWGIMHPLPAGAPVLAAVALLLFLGVAQNRKHAND